MLKREEMIERLASRGFTKRDSKIIIQDVFDVITEALAEGESVHIHGFGTFNVREIKARKTHNVRTGRKAVVPGYKTPCFIAGETLKNAIKKGVAKEE